MDLPHFILHPSAFILLSPTSPACSTELPLESPQLHPRERSRMFPLQDNIPSRTTPFCNYLLIGLCTLVFLKQATEDPEGVTLVERYGMIPARVFNPREPVTITVDEH